MNVTPSLATLILAECNGIIFNLAGPANRITRQQIMSELTGQRVPIAKSGVHAIDKALRECFGIKEGTIREQERKLQARLIDRAGGTS